jgi:hypothetical protein
MFIEEIQFTDLEDDFEIKKQQIVNELLKENDNIDPRYYDYNNPEFTAYIRTRDITDKHLLENDKILREKIKRRLEVDYNSMIGSQYFSVFSLSTIISYHAASIFHPAYLFFIQCTSGIHPLNEAIIKFVAERNQIEKTERIPRILEKLVSKNSISNACAKSSEAIYESYRNDIHHLNPGVDKIKDWHDFARRNFRNIATIEHDVFGYRKKGGIVSLNYPQYWDYGYDSTNKPDYHLRIETSDGLAKVAIRGIILHQNAI